MKLSFRASPKYALALAAIFLCVSAGVVVLFTMGLKMYLGDLYAQRSVLASAAQTKIDYLNKAISMAYYQDPYYLTLANNYMSEANQAAINNTNVNAVSDDLGLAIQAGRQRRGPLRGVGRAHPRQSDVLRQYPRRGRRGGAATAGRRRPHGHALRRPP